MLLSIYQYFPVYKLEIVTKYQRIMMHCQMEIVQQESLGSSEMGLEHFRY